VKNSNFDSDLDWLFDWDFDFDDDASQQSGAGCGLPNRLGAWVKGLKGWLKH
jgi:hypothetical protein